ncbi:MULTISPECIES: AlpA family transcriptional regulator [Pseudomonadota]|uniref:AlpA family transcriptional regulator n=1 Tax=Pseudomonadota TaxID=1224 RepID=UPI0009E706C9|nr:MULTISPECIES: AlpA family transcriptional regulator [Pseudomonadota]
MTSEPPKEAVSPHSDEAAPLPTRLLRLPDVMARVGMKRSAIYQRMSEGKFPKSRSLGPKCAVWIEAEIDAWIANIASYD